MQTPRYTVENAATKYIGGSHYPEHPNADDEGNVTFVSLSWDNPVHGSDFISTSFPGRPSVLEAFQMAADEMNRGHERTAAMRPVVHALVESTGCDLDDAWEIVEAEWQA